MESLIFRGRPDERNECDQWTLVKEPDDPEEFVVQEHVRLDAVRSGNPYLRLVRRMTVAEFLATGQPEAVKLKLRAILDARKTQKGR
jgi:hypothetical protein